MTALMLLMSLAQAATPKLIGCLSTTDGTLDASDSWTTNFTKDGRLIFVATNPAETASGWFELRVDGELYVSLLSGTHDPRLYHNDATGGRPYSELMANAYASWGSKTVSIRYSNEFVGADVGSNPIQGCVYYQKGAQIRTNGVALTTLCSDPNDSDSTDFTYSIPYAGFVVSELTCGSGGGGFSWYIDGVGLVQQEADCDSRPAVLAFPMVPQYEAAFEIIHEDDSFPDNTGTRCVDVTYLRD